MGELVALPECVCAYGTRADLQASRVESGQWVFWHDRVDLVLEGRYDEVKPLHVELSPTYLCNFACPWCSCRSAREDWIGEDVFAHPLATDATVMSDAKLAHVIDHLAEYRIGIMWVGGEPTMHRGLYPAARRARDLGLQQCLFSNGSLLNVRRIDDLLDAELVFIRISLDAVDDEVHRVHHGYRQGRPYAGKVKDNLSLLVRRRNERGSTTKVGVSVVVDERNLHDVVRVAHHLRDLADAVGDRAVDYLIVRPTYQFYDAQLELQPDTRENLWRLVNASGEVREVLRGVGIDVVAPGASFTDALAEETSSCGQAEGATRVLLRSKRESTSPGCLAAGWFGEVTSNGDMVVCSDRYGNPDYFVGNLADEGVSSIWEGSARSKVLDDVRATRCFEERCPRNGRGYHLNTVFRQIEAYRQRGQMGAVRKWIDGLREVLPVPVHPFFL